MSPERSTDTLPATPSLIKGIVNVFVANVGVPSVKSVADPPIRFVTAVTKSAAIKRSARHFGVGTHGFGVVPQQFQQVHI